jgi:hypothetical protein
MFWNKPKDFVEISNGKKVYIKRLTNYQYDKALAKSTVVENGVNYALFLNICESYMVCLSLFSYRRLSVKDSYTLRRKVIEMLTEDNIVKKPEPKKEIISDTPNFNVSQKDNEWFLNQRRVRGF